MLRSLSLFSDLNPNELEELAKIISETKVARGTVIFSQGDMTRDFFIIKHGQIEISVKEHFQEKRVISILKSGEFFGEMSLFEKNAPRSATATAFQNTTLYKIPGRAFESLLEDQPSICFKLLGTMSKRLREIINPGSQVSEFDSPKNGRVVTIASARSGYGKTTLATTMAFVLSHELPRRVLFLDLDLSYGDGTFLMGVYSPTSILDLAQAIRSENLSEEHFRKFIARLNNNLSLLAAPKELIDSEKLTGEDLIHVINTCRRYFDYIVIDTNVNLSENFLNALDMSDQILFIVEGKDSISIKSNNAFFRAITHLNLPDTHVGMVLSYRNRGAPIDSFQKVFRWRLVGELPAIPNMKLDTGELPYQQAPDGDFCNSVRLILKSIFQEDSLQITSEAGFLRRWFLPQSARLTPTSQIPGEDVQMDPDLAIDEEYCSTLLKDIRGEITKGFLDEALKQCLQLVALIPNSAIILQVLGEIFFLKRDFAHALEVLNKALKLDPTNHLAMGHVAIIKNSEELQKQALEILSLKLETNPNYPDLHNDMGKLLFSFNRLEEATGQFEHALELNPQYTEARINLALTLGEAHRFEEALRQLFKVTPKNIRTYYLIGNYFFSTGKFYEAIAAYNRVSEINSRYLDVHAKLESLGDYFSKLNNLLELHKKLSKNSPTYPDLHYKMGHLYLLVGKRDLAKEEFQWANELKPNYKDTQRKIDDLNAGLELDVMQYFEDEHRDQKNVKAQSTSWDITFINIDSLIRIEPQHLYVARLSNMRTTRKAMFALPGQEANAPKRSYETGFQDEIQIDDPLRLEIFDHTGVIYSIEHRISTTEFDQHRIIIPAGVSSSPETKETATPLNTAQGFAPAS